MGWYGGKCVKLSVDGFKASSYLPAFPPKHYTWLALLKDDIHRNNESELVPQIGRNAIGHSQWFIFAWEKKVLISRETILYWRSECFYTISCAVCVYVLSIFVLRLCSVKSPGIWRRIRLYTCERLGVALYSPDTSESLIYLRPRALIFLPLGQSFKNHWENLGK